MGLEFRTATILPSSRLDTTTNAYAPRSRLAALRTALEKENPQALEQEAHALKGEASTLGAAQMETLCEALMRFVSEGRLAQVEELLDALDSAFLRARAALEPAKPA